MSSDSEASHSSAHRDDEEETDIVEGESAVVEQRHPFEEDATGDNGVGDDEDEELRSIASRSNGLTFARVRNRGMEPDEEETASELSLRPKVGRRESLESTSTPDDTPSIQVCLAPQT
jgi:hypothetical protein